MDFQKERVGREILEQDFLWTLERTRRETLPGVQRRLRIGLSGFIRGETVGANRRKRICGGGVLAGRGRERQSPSRTRTAGSGRAASADLRTETAAGGRGLLRAPALGGLWDSGGRSRASEALKRTAKPGDRAGLGKGRWRKWASASVGRCSALRPVRTEKEDIFPDRRLLSRGALGRAAVPGATSPLTACVGLATPLASPAPGRGWRPPRRRAPDPPLSRPAPTPESWNSAREAPPEPRGRVREPRPGRLRELPPQPPAPTYRAPEQGPEPPAAGRGGRPDEPGVRGAAAPPCR